VHFKLKTHAWALGTVQLHGNKQQQKQQHKYTTNPTRDALPAHRPVTHSSASKPMPLLMAVAPSKERKQSLQNHACQNKRPW